MKPVITLIIVSSFIANAQNDTSSSIKNTHSIEKPVVPSSQGNEEPKLFPFDEPEFPGGVTELLKFLQKNIHYPQMEKDSHISGKVYVKFVVLEDGSLENIQILRGLSPGLDAEALRVVKLLPKFKPGMQEGKPVRTQYNLAVAFKLPE